MEVALLFVVVGFLIAVSFSIKVVLWRRVSLWKPVEAKITGMRISVKKLNMWPAALDEYWPRIEYEYFVNGIPYHGYEISVRDKNFASVDKQEIELFLENLKGVSIAYVNPRNFQKAVLKNTLTWKHISYLITYWLIGFLLFNIGVILFLLLR